jgi:hypothetical protein
MGKNKLRPVVIVIEAESADNLRDIEPFIRNAIAESDDGSMIIRQVKVQVVQPTKGDK